MNVETVKQQFAQYYQMFDADRSQLGSFFSEESQLNFESGDVIVGREAIIAKFTSLPFQKVDHIITTIDVQTTGDSGILVVVNGQLKTDEDKPMGFTETFILRQKPDGSLFIANDVFRISLHNF
ncbi:nuclear transport factor 2-like [Watersipora subatra]|uniref:nuclear transport factor 2-like n=1 Tax=Watersipora subatra TaxID=2589382 RepID=UPI00355C1636